MSASEARQTMRLGLGRIFRLMSRPAQEGDVAQYENARRACLEAAEVLGISAAPVPLGSCRSGWNFGNGSVE